MIKYILTLIICFCLTSCKNKNMEIESIDKELNDKAEFGIQYFEISNYKNLSNDELIDQLEVFEKNII